MKDILDRVIAALERRLESERDSRLGQGRCDPRLGGRPTNVLAYFCGELRLGWLILEPRDPEAAQ